MNLKFASIQNKLQQEAHKIRLKQLISADNKNPLAFIQLS